MSRLIETIRFSEGRIQNIDYHLRRMNDSCLAVFSEMLQWKPDQMLATLALPSTDIYKIRIAYDYRSGTITHEPYTIRPVRSLKLVFDNNIEYEFKFENRLAIERLAALKEDCDDVLIIKNDLVTDVSYANIIFRENDQWITPKSFLLNGTMRQFMLDRGMIIERGITVNDIKEFSHFKLINAMLRNEAPESQVLNIH